MSTSTQRPRPATAAEQDLAASVDAMRRVIRELRIIARKSELTAGLSAAQAFVLTALSTREPASVSDVASLTMTDRSSAAAVIDRLVELGLVGRKQSSEDRRRAELSLTSAGRRALRNAAPPPTAVLIDAIGGLSDTERRHLAIGLTALTRQMDIHEDPAGMLFEDAPRAATRKRSRRG